jgi:predicted ATPase
MLEDKSDARSTAIYFIQRQVLGSFKSADDLVSVIKTIGNSRPDIAHRIKQLLESDLKTNGVKTIQKFDPEKFRVNFFYFPCYHPKTVEGFNRLEQVIQRLTTGDRGMRHLQN